LPLIYCRGFYGFFSKLNKQITFNCAQLSAKAFQINLLQPLLCKGSQVFGKAGIRMKKDDILSFFVDTTRDSYESIVSD
jgi:hypothetical protein